jgi:hypothetical protein
VVDSFPGMCEALDSIPKTPTPTCFCVCVCVCVCVCGTGVRTQDLMLAQGRRSTTWPLHQLFFLLGIFKMRSGELFVKAGLEP